VAEPLPAWLRPTAAGVSLLLHVQPGAKRTEVVGAHGDALKLRLAAPPVDGRANACLLDYLAATLGIPSRSLRLLSGETSRRKRVEANGVTAAEALSRLGVVWLEKGETEEVPR